MFGADVPIQRHPVSSSNVKSIGFSGRLGVLEVEFHNGGVYRYAEVTIDEAMSVMGAPSKGQAVREIQESRPSLRMKPKPESSAGLDAPDPGPPAPPLAPKVKLSCPVVPSLDGLDPAILKEAVAQRPALPLHMHQALVGAARCTCGGNLRPIGDSPQEDALVDPQEDALVETGKALGEAGVVRCDKCGAVDASPAGAAAVLAASEGWVG